MNENKKIIIKEVVEWIYCIIIAIILALLIRYFVGTPTVVRMTSMVSTIEPGQRLILNRLVKTFNITPKQGDIITFEAPSNSRNGATSVKANYDYEPEGLFNKFVYYVLENNKTSYIKRVIAVPGDKVKIAEGKVFVNDVELKEDYLQEGVITEAKSPYLTDFTVPEGYIFAMGDNRANSTDCRYFGCIPISKIESIVWIRIWPLNLFGKIN